MGGGELFKIVFVLCGLSSDQIRGLTGQRPAAPTLLESQLRIKDNL
jgi:hypothetical protein